MNTRRVVVVGGGIAGLATAYRVRQRARERGIPVDVLVLERERAAGGKVATVREGGFLSEAGPAGFLDNEPATLRLVDDLKLRTELLRSSDASRERYLWRGGRMHALAMHPLKFMRSPLLSLSGRLGVVGELWKPARRYPAVFGEGELHLAKAGIPPEIPVADDESVAGFGRRRLGAEFTAILLDSMVSGIYAGDIDRLSLVAAFPKIVDLERRHGGLLKGMRALKKERRGAGEVEAGPGGVLHTFRSGMAVPIEALIRELGSRAVRSGVTLRGIADYGPRGGFRLAMDVAGGQHETLDCDAVVLAVPANDGARILREYAPPAAQALGEIAIAGVHVVCAGYRREQVGHPLNGFGMLIPRREGPRILGSIWASSTFEGQAPQGQVQLRTLVGGAHDPAASALSDADLVSLVRRETEPVYAITGEPSYLRLFRWPLGIPQYDVGHLGRVARARKECARHPGLFLTGNSTCGVSFNQCVAHSEVVAAQVLQFLAPEQCVSGVAASGVAVKA